jgi:hypothetical protein
MSNSYLARLRQLEEKPGTKGFVSFGSDCDSPVLRSKALSQGSTARDQISKSPSHEDRQNRQNPSHELCRAAAVTTNAGFVSSVSAQSRPVLESGAAVRLGGLSRIFQELERRCPDHIDSSDWQVAVEDGRKFLAQWGKQAEALDWSARDLFGLAPVPEKPSGNYRRLARYDLTGLVWLLRGRPVVALTDATAAIANPDGNTLIYRRHNKPSLGPVGDSLGDFTR